MNNIYNPTINLDYYKKDLIQKINGHLSSLRIMLSSLEDNDFLDKLKNIKDTTRFSLQFVDIDKSKIKTEECNKCFKSIVQSLFDFLDIMFACKNLMSEKILFDSSIKNQNDLLDFLNEQINNEIQKVSRNQRLKVPEKVKRFNLDKFSEESLLANNKLRNCLEHHKRLPKEDIKLLYYEMVLFNNENKIISFPFTATSGTISYKVLKRQKTFKKGKKVELSEKLIKNIVFTIQINIVSRIIKNIIKTSHNKSYT